MVAPLFFGLLFAIIEVAMIFLASQVLETVTQDSARMIMTGQAQGASYTQQQFKDFVCGRVSALFDCTNGIFVDVRSYPSFSSVNITPPIDSTNAFVPTMKWCPGKDGDVVVVRLFYQWPLFVTKLGFNVANLGNGKRLLTATATFKNEPSGTAGHMLMSKVMKTLPAVLLRSVAALRHDRRGLAAVEFAFILPLMLVMFFGTVEVSSGVAVDRKVTLMARAASDLTSQATAVVDTDLQNFFSAAVGIMTPYDPTPTKITLSEIYVDPSKIARIQWSKAGTIATGAAQATLTPSTRSQGDVVTNLVPSALLIPGTYLIFSEVSYQYVPTIGYVMAKSGINLSDVAYTRPRQSLCVNYSATSSTASSACTTY